MNSTGSDLVLQFLSAMTNVYMLYWWIYTTNHNDTPMTHSLGYNGKKHSKCLFTDDIYIWKQWKTLNNTRQKTTVNGQKGCHCHLSRCTTHFGW